jgi:hypothetical protein
MRMGTFGPGGDFGPIHSHKDRQGTGPAASTVGPNMRLSHVARTRSRRPNFALRFVA